jgi:REP-associated tyrosine transposase
MPSRLHRCSGLGYLHFITFSCYHRRHHLNTPQRRTLFLEILEQVRERYNFVVVGYVVMPDHVHLMFSEPEHGNPSTMIQVLKQRFARKVSKECLTQNPSQLAEDHVWQRRFYDFPVWDKRQARGEAAVYAPQPGDTGLVTEPEQWAWSSYRHYALGERGPVLVNELQHAPMKVREGAPDATAHEG